MKVYKQTKFDGKNYVEEIEYEKPKQDVSVWRHVGSQQLVNIDTGEVKNIKPKLNKNRSDKSTNRTLRTINLLIQNNFNTEAETVYSIDFTYCMQPKGYEEFQKDLTKLKRKLKRIEQDVKMIVVKEKGRHNNYHGHMIVSNIYLTKEIFKKALGTWKTNRF